MVSHRSRAGWSRGMLSAWKLSSSVSTSGLSTTTNPNCPKTRAISRSVSRMGCSEPRHSGRPGSVTSTRSALKRTSSAIDASRSRRSEMAASISSRMGLASAPTRGRSSVGSAPMPLNSARSSPLRPRKSASTAVRRSGVSDAAMAASARRRSESSCAWNEARSMAGGLARRYWARATSAMRENVAASRTQMSARTLRSMITPASLRPWMSLP